VIAAVEGGAAAPATAPNKQPAGLDHEVRPVVDQLPVEAHDRAARTDLSLVEVPLLQLVDGGLHQRSQRGDVAPGGQAADQRLLIAALGQLHDGG
jgi:hypothetical protein